MQTAHISLVASKATQQRWRECWREIQEGIRRLWDQCVSFNFHTVKGLCNNRAQMGGGEPTSACWCTGAFFFLGLHGPTVSYWIKRAAAEVEKWWRTPVLFLEGKQLESFTFDWQKIFTVKYIQSYSFFFLENRKGSWQRINDERLKKNPLAVDAAQECERYYSFSLSVQDATVPPAASVPVNALWWQSPPSFSSSSSSPLCVTLLPNPQAILWTQCSLFVMSNCLQEY